MAAFGAGVVGPCCSGCGSTLAARRLLRFLSGGRDRRLAALVPGRGLLGDLLAARLGRRLGLGGLRLRVLGRFRRRLGRLGRLVADYGQYGADLDGLVLLHPDLQHGAGDRGGDLRVDLVGGDLEQRLVGLNRVTDRLEPPADRAFGDALAQGGQGHLGATGRAAGGRGLGTGGAAAVAGRLGLLHLVRIDRRGRIGLGLDRRLRLIAAAVILGRLRLLGRRIRPAASCSLASPITASTAPTSTVSSSWALISSSTPAVGDGISVSTLSVETSSNGSSASTVSPTCLSHRLTVPSVTLSPSAGRVTEVDMSG